MLCLCLVPLLLLLLLGVTDTHLGPFVCNPEPSLTLVICSFDRLHSRGGHVCLYLSLALANANKLCKRSLKNFCLLKDDQLSFVASVRSRNCTLTLSDDHLPLCVCVGAKSTVLQYCQLHVLYCNNSTVLRADLLRSLAVLGSAQFSVATHTVQLMLHSTRTTLPTPLCVCVSVCVYFELTFCGL